MANNEPELVICYTSDCHGNFESYARCIASFPKGGNVLTIDGGDTFQGSPMCWYLFRQRADSGDSFPAKIMNLAGVDFITLGNHDFSFGKEALSRYLSESRAVCLCANVEGLENVRKTAVVTMENGLRVGLAGITSPLIPQWEPAENVEGLVFSDAFEAASAACEELKRQNTDLRICIYHGGFEMPPEEYDPRNSQISEAELQENQGLRIARDLDFDVLLCAHQHMPFQGKELCGTFICQTGEKCASFLQLRVRKGDVRSAFITPEKNGDPAAGSLISSLKSEMDGWLHSAAGELDIPLPADEHLHMALNGCLLANFFNQVQLSASGADISCTSLSNTPGPLPEKPTVEDVLRCYVFPNTLRVLRVDRKILKAALERSAEYFSLGENGEISVSRAFLEPMLQHFNFDYFSGIDCTLDLSHPSGSRVSSIRFSGRELEEDRTLTLCMNNYRASGAGGYPFYSECEVAADIQTEVSELILDYLSKNKKITVDKHRWLTVNR